MDIDAPIPHEIIHLSLRCAIGAFLGGSIGYATAKTSPNVLPATALASVTGGAVIMIGTEWQASFVLLFLSALTAGCLLFFVIWYGLKLFRRLAFHIRGRIQTSPGYSFD